VKHLVAELSTLWSHYHKYTYSESFLQDQ